MASEKKTRGCIFSSEDDPVFNELIKAEIEKMKPFKPLLYKNLVEETPGLIVKACKTRRGKSF